MSGKKERERRREERIRKEEETEARQRRHRLIQLGSVAGFLVIIALVIVIVAISQSGGGGGTNLADVGLVEEQLSGLPQQGTTLGEPKAKVTLIEYGDLQCPICKEFSEEVIPQIISGPVTRGEAKIDFRNYTIISQESVPAGAAALAAGEQGRGWNFIELFYRNQGEERSGYVTDEFLTSIAKGARVPDISTWNKERNSQRLLREVKRTTDQASEDWGFEGTPSFVVKGPSGTEPLGTPGSAEEIEAAIGEVR
jgi:protein-disulfide isomerase